MSYLTRETICNRLSLSTRQSYSIVGSSYGPLINSEEVLALVNRARREIPEPFRHIPRLLKPDEMAKSKELEQTGLSAHDLLVWTRRSRKVAPHVRFNKQTTRFEPESFLSWLSDQSHVRRLS